MTVKEERDLFQGGRCWEASGRVSQGLSRECWKDSQVYGRKSGTKVEGSLQVSSAGGVDHCRGVSLGEGLQDTGQSLLLEGMVSIPSGGCFALRVFCLSLETSWKEEPIQKV